MTSRVAAEIAGPAMRRAAIALLSILVAGGVVVAQQPAKPKTPAATQPAKPSAADNSKCIGVISAIGDTFNLQKVGFTVFGNELNHVPIDSWQIDNLVIAKISAFLSKSWTVRRINYPKGAFSSLDEQHPLFFNYAEELQGIVRRLASSTKCDHYVVAVKSSSRYGTTNQTVGGLGIVEVRNPLYGVDYIFALYSIRVYDGQTFALLGGRGAILEESFGSTIRGPNREVDKFWWPESDAAKSTMLRDGIRSLVEKSLDKTMPLILRVE
jgi:hypothetical protein